MSSLDILAKTKPSENSGASSANRFDYQINWGLTKLLDLESRDEDYVMILDYQDDIVVCNSDKQSDFIDFYQIKTKDDGNWTLQTLSKKTDNKTKDNKEKQIGKTNQKDKKNVKSGYSILAKLFLHTKIFKKTRNLYFVTNAHVAFTNSPNIVPFSNFSKEAQSSIKKRIDSEIGPLDNKVYDRLTIIQHQMQTSGYKESLQGTLMNFLIDKFHLSTGDVPIIYNTVIAELKRKNNYESLVDNKEDLIKYKAITHEEFRGYLEALTVLKSFEDIEKKIISDLKTSEYSREELTFTVMTSIRKSFNKIKTDLLDYNNDELRRLMILIASIMEDTELDPEVDLDLWKYTCRIFNILSGKYNNYKNYPELYMKTLILYQYEKLY